MKWEFYDPHIDQSYAFDINPLNWNMSILSKSVEDRPTAYGRRQIAFEGRRKPQTMSFSGTILNEHQYNALQNWANKRYQIRLTDDLNRVMWIYITKFAPQRQLHPNDPFYFNYSVEATILDWQ